MTIMYIIKMEIAENKIKNMQNRKNRNSMFQVKHSWNVSVNVYRGIVESALSTYVLAMNSSEIVAG